MGYRSDCYGRGQALHGDKTTTGAVCLSSLPNATEHCLPIVRVGDATTACKICGRKGKIISGEVHSIFDGLASAVDGSHVLCGCPPGTNRVIAPAGQWIGAGKSPSQHAQEKWEAEQGTIRLLQAEKEAAEQAKRSAPVYAKSRERGPGNTEAGTVEETHLNFGHMAYYVATPVEPAPPKEVVQHAQAVKRKRAKGETGIPWYRQMLSAKAETPQQSVMPLAVPIATTSGRALAASGMQLLRGMAIAGGQMFTTGGVGVVGMLYSRPLNQGENDYLSASQLAALARKSAPTRIRFQWVDAGNGRLKPVAYHTSPESGQDQVRVRPMWRNSHTGDYEFWADGAVKPTIVWTPAETEFKAPANTGNRDEPYQPTIITVLPLPDAKELGSIPTSLPVPDEKSFDDYILINLPHDMPPVYIYLSNDHKYHVVPKGNPPLAAFPDAKRAPRKTSLKGGGGLRMRWKDLQGKIYEWDSQHGTVEIYDKSGRNHLGEFNPENGIQTKPADPTRRVEK